MTALFFGKSKFRIGALVVTDGAARNLTLNDLTQGLTRHASCRWGNVDRATKLANKEALETGGRVVSAFTATNGVKFQIITEWNRSTTTVTLTEEEKPQMKKSIHARQKA